MSRTDSNLQFRKYFHDRFVLLALTVNTFLTMLVIAFVFLNLGDTSGSYIQSYRSNLGLNAYQVGGPGQIISFAAFAVAAWMGQFVISLRFYGIRKHVSWIIMVLGTFLLILSLIVSNALIQLR